MNALSSPLGRIGGLSSLTASEREAAERRMWREDGRLFVGVSDKDLEPDERSVIERIGKDRFGER